MKTLATSVIAVALVACGGPSRPVAPTEPTPAPTRVVVIPTAVDAVGPIQFTTGTELGPTDYAVLDAVAATLTNDRDIASLEVQVRIPQDGAEADTRQALAQRRADALVAYLVTKKGIAASRLTGQGYVDPPPSPAASHASFLIIRRGSSCDRPELEKRIAELEQELAHRARVASETAISLDGSALTIKAAKTDEVRGIDDKAAVAASKQFLDVVSGSRAAIQACYQQALKTNTALQSRTVTLTISASFTKAGTHQRSSTAPALGDTFDGCMTTLMTAWSLPGITSAMTFKAQVTLTP